MRSDVHADVVAGAGVPEEHDRLDALQAVAAERQDLPACAGPRLLLRAGGAGQARRPGDDGAAGHHAGAGVVLGERRGRRQQRQRGEHEDLEQTAAGSGSIVGSMHDSSCGAYGVS